MNRLIIVGSPRVDGRSAHLAETLFETCIAEYPGDEVALAPVSTLDIAPCTGCDACKDLVDSQEIQQDSAEGDAAGEDGFEGESILQRCVIQDDMEQLGELLEAADELVVVSPVYFAGPPAQLKALLDRMQPYFWTSARTQPKLPATLHVVGEGGDPHGFEPLVGTVRSALSCAGFSLNRVVDWVGKIDADGKIIAEADEYTPIPLGGAPGTGGSVLQVVASNMHEIEREMSAEGGNEAQNFTAYRGGSAKPVLRVSRETPVSPPPEGDDRRSATGGAKKSGGNKTPGARKKSGQGSSGGSRGGQVKKCDNQGSGRGNQGNGRPSQGGKHRG